MEITIGTGAIVTGIVTGITKYGAFVKIEPQYSGMIHISEISDDFIKDAGALLKAGQSVRAVVLGEKERGKFALSIKRLPESEKEPLPNTKIKSPKSDQNFTGSPEEYSRRPLNPKQAETFEDMMKKYKRDSEEKISALKKALNPKRCANPKKTREKK